MELLQVKASEILSFAESMISKASPIIPITPFRAISQAANPAVKPDDILLVVALEEQQQVAGYIGILPAPSPKKGFERICWNTCWWVDKNAGAGISMTLLSQFLKLTKGRVLFSDMAEHTATIMEKLGGFTITSRKGEFIRFRHALHKRYKRSKVKSPLLRIAASLSLLRLHDAVRNVAVERRIARHLRNNGSECEITWHSQMSPSQESFIADHAGSDVTVPNAAMFMWWAKYPWLAPPVKENTALESRYYFSCIAEEVQTSLIEVRESGDSIGLAICTFINGTVKTHYLYYIQDQEERFFESLFRTVLLPKANHTLITFHPGFAEYTRSRKKLLISAASLTRFAGYADVLLKECNEISFQDGDGDYIFT